MDVTLLAADGVAVAKDGQVLVRVRTRTSRRFESFQRLFYGVEQLVARHAHNVKVASSSLAPVTKLLRRFVCKRSGIGSVV